MKTHRTLSIRHPFAFVGFALLLLTMVAGAGCTPQFFDATSWSGVVSVDNGPVVYYGSKFGGVVALNIETQKKVWRQPAPTGDVAKDSRRAVYSTPLLHDGLLHFGDFEGNVYAVTPEGALKWQKTIPGGIITDPVFHEKSPGQTLVLYGSSEGAVRAFDAASGAEQWTFSASKQPVWGTPAILASTVYVPSMDGNLYAVDISTGKETWRYTTGGPVAASVTVNGSNIIFGSFDKKLYALNAVTRQPAWAFPGGNWFWTQAVVQDGVLYAGGLDHNLYALDPTTGSEKWHFRTGGAIRSTPTILNGKVIIGSEDGNVYALGITDGAQAWKQSIGVPIYAQVVPVGDTLYVAGQDGLLYALDASNGVRRWSYDSQKKES